ncbi:hypothetical protein [Streptomyces pristinaespiralis]
MSVRGEEGVGRSNCSCLNPLPCRHRSGKFPLCTAS